MYFARQLNWDKRPRVAKYVQIQQNNFFFFFLDWSFKIKFFFLSDINIFFLRHLNLNWTGKSFQFYGMKRNLLLFFIVTVSCFTVTEICFKLKKKMYFKISTASSFFYFFLLTPNFYLKMFCYSFQKASENPLVTIDGGSEPTSKLSTIFFSVVSRRYDVIISNSGRFP